MNTATKPQALLLKRKVGEEVLSVWNKASMPTIAYKSILESLRKVVDSGQSAQKFGASKRCTEKFKKIQDEFEKVFDICRCKCDQKGIKERQNCHCVVKIPLEEWDFWVDQTGARKMMIGPIDLVKSAAKKKRVERKRKYDQFSQRCRESSTKEDEGTEGNAEEQEESDEEQEESGEDGSERTGQNSIYNQSHGSDTETVTRTGDNIRIYAE